MDAIESLVEEEVRDRFVGFLLNELVGPMGGATEVICDPPNRRYLAGTIFPRPGDARIDSAVQGVLQTDLRDELDPKKYEETFGAEGQAPSAPVEASTKFLPSSMGVSFFTSASEIVVTCSAGRYITIEAAETPGQQRGERTWQRVETMHETVAASSSVRKYPVFNQGRGNIDVRWRHRPDGNLVTVTLSNSAVASTVAVERMWDEMLTQAELRISMPAGSLLEYPSIVSETMDEEEQELRLQYRNHASYAVGHGAAPAWTTTATADTVDAVTVPQSTVRGTSTELSRDYKVSPLAFDATAMADPDSSRELVCSALDSLVDNYKTWRVGLGGDEPVARRITARVAETEARMRAGVDVLRNDDTSWLAFQLANRAMILQYQRSMVEYAGVRRTIDDLADLSPQSLDHVIGRPWRPFQIGFFLSILPGLADAGSVDRELVDLIWFPTGGGKTEAYLLAAAYEIFRRRLADGEFGAGTAVLSRYTLSLLTAQQFQRASGTILACEIIRRERDDLGDRPISIGLWVGDATTKNRFGDAHKQFTEERANAEPSDIFIVDRCSWCGTEIMPRVFSEDDRLYGVTSSGVAFMLNCPRQDCPFHDALPIHVVDDQIYEEVPSFILGTVDKFADLPWNRRGGTFLGNFGQFAPPSLIIQDELHLLTGPLGTTVGIYEHAIEIACERDGRPPKVVASTATVRRATEQVRGLFGRDVAVFPPPGTDEADSFFARRDEAGPGRLYLGVMPQGHTSDTAVVHTLSALLQAPVSLNLTALDRDRFWTVVAYHSSLQELGRTVTIARDDVPLRLAARFGDSARSLQVDDIEELTANVERAAQPRLLERLAKREVTGDAISVLAATNMLSVGVDVPRLGLMLVNGQPKGTSEYIQATSRVGRSGPGLIISVFRSARPRDRSHFETFASYHSALYRHVEPTTVTPYSSPSQRRSLHAALVILARFHAGLPNNGDAGKAFPSHEADIRALADRLVAVVNRVDPRESSLARDILGDFIDEWAKSSAESTILYTDGKEQVNRLLKEFGQSGSGTSTLRSMRNVDAQTPLRVRGRDVAKKGTKK